MTLQYLLFLGLDSGLLFLRERRQGIWLRLRCAPIGFSALLAGKALATALVALAQIVVTFAVGAAFFGVRVNGSWPGFVLMAGSAALLSAGHGPARRLAGRQRDAGAERVDPGHPDPLAARRALAAGVPAARLGADARAGPADDVGGAAASKGVVWQGMTFAPPGPAPRWSASAPRSCSSPIGRLRGSETPSRVRQAF